MMPPGNADSLKWRFDSTQVTFHFLFAIVEGQETRYCYLQGY